MPPGKGNWEGQQTLVIQPDEPRENGRKTGQKVQTPTHILLTFSNLSVSTKVLLQFVVEARTPSGTQQVDSSFFALRVPHTEARDSPAGLSFMDPQW